VEVPRYRLRYRFVNAFSGFGVANAWRGADRQSGVIDSQHPTLMLPVAPAWAGLIMRWDRIGVEGRVRKLM
jgi:hypothetical protein